MRILVVEDEPDIAAGIFRLFRAEDFVVDVVDRLEHAQESIRSFKYDAVILDRRLPDGDGLELIRYSKRHQLAQRFLLLSALADLNERLSGLDCGADDYLVKPFEPRELVARIRALLRRPKVETANEIIVGGLVFDRDTRNVAVNGRPFLLARKELLVLEALISSYGRVLVREDLVERVYGFQDDVQSTAIEAHLSRLRAKLKAADAHVTIGAVRGIGYFLQAQDTGK